MIMEVTRQQYQDEVKAYWKGRYDKLQAENERLKGVIHDVIILTEESSTKEFAEQALKGE